MAEVGAVAVDEEVVPLASGGSTGGVAASGGAIDGMPASGFVVGGEREAAGEARREVGVGHRGEGWQRSFKPVPPRRSAVFLWKADVFSIAALRAFSASSASRSARVSAASAERCARALWRITAAAGLGLSVLRYVCRRRQ